MGMQEASAIRHAVSTMEFPRCSDEKKRELQSSLGRLGFEITKRTKTGGGHLNYAIFLDLQERLKVEQQDEALGVGQTGSGYEQGAQEASG